MKAALKDLLFFMPRLVRLVGGLAADSRLPRHKRVSIGLSALYLASPIDLIPDWIPVLGQIDDFIVAAVLLDSLFENVPEEVLRSHWVGPPGQLEAMRSVAGAVAWAIPEAVKRRITG